MQHSETLGELGIALTAAQSEFSAVPKDSVNPFFKSKYAALPEVVKSATPILTRHGLSIAQFIGYSEGQDTLTTVLLHCSGEYIAETMRLHLVKNDPQGQGSAVTYARRYSYMSVLGLVADEDDDGNAASSNIAASKPAFREAQETARAAASRPAPAPATGDKIQVSPTVLATLQYAETVNQRSGEPNGMLSDIVKRAAKWPITPKQLNAAIGAAKRVFAANNEDFDEVERNIAHTNSQIENVFGSVDYLPGEEPF